MKPIRIAAISALALACSLPLRAADRKAIEAEFNQAYDGRNLALQTFYDGETLHYSAWGDFVKGGRPGPWTIDAFIRIERVRLKPSEIIFDGRRLGYLYSERDRGFVAAPGLKVSIAIKLAMNPRSATVVEEAMSRVFMRKDQKLVDIVPDYWKPVLLDPGASRLKLCENGMSRLPTSQNEAPSDIRKSCTALVDNVQKPPQQQHPAPSESVRPIVEPGTTPPVALHRSQPKYATAALEGLSRGTVTLAMDVRADGGVGNVVIIKPLGRGLDDAAVSAIREWKFSPATRNGIPVAAPIEVEFIFLGGHWVAIGGWLPTGGSPPRDGGYGGPH